MSSDAQVALVTGASRGIGRAIAVALAQTGRRVLINYRARRDAAEETLRLVTQAGGSGEIIQFDVTDGPAVERAVADVLQRHGRVDVLVNNAGVRSDMLMVWMQAADWNKVLDANLTSFFHVTRLIVKDMALRRSGRIVNIASVSGLSGMAGQVAYSASKAGLIGATQALAREVAKRNVTVNAIAPGFIATNLTAPLVNDPKFDEWVKQRCPLARWGTPEDIAWPAVFLASAAADFITGQVLYVDGGWMATF